MSVLNEDKNAVSVYDIASRSQIKMLNDAKRHFKNGDMRQLLLLGIKAEAKSDYYVAMRKLHGDGCRISESVVKASEMICIEIRKMINRLA